MSVRRLMLVVMIVLLTVIMVSLAQKVLLFRQVPDEVNFSHFMEIAH